MNTYPYNRVEYNFFTTFFYAAKLLNNVEDSKHFDKKNIKKV